MTSKKLARKKRLAERLTAEFKEGRPRAWWSPTEWKLRLSQRIYEADAGL